MDEPLPSSVDVVVVGTGLGEALLAAAAARSGLSVLHLDQSSYYGAEWASFNLRSLDEWIDERRKRRGGEDEEENEPSPSLLSEGESFVRLHRAETIHGLRDEWTEASSQREPNPSEGVKIEEAETGEKGEEKEDKAEERGKTQRELIEEEWRRWSVDLTPKVLLARGDLVRTLCDSQVSAYAEFKLVDRLLGVSVAESEPSSSSSSPSSASLHRIPCSRGEIFDTELLSMLEKRRLMKFLQLCLQWHKESSEKAEGGGENEDGGEPVPAKEASSLEEFADRPFSAFLTAQGIQGRLRDLITRSLSFLTPTSDGDTGRGGENEGPSTRSSLSALCRFMDSVGTFGPSPFLTPLYGSGELPQCFARLSAVFGGLYCLGRRIEGVAVREGRVTAVLAAGQRVACTHLLTTAAFVPREWREEEGHGARTQRAILLARGSIAPSTEREHISLVNLGGLAASTSPAGNGGRFFEGGWEACLAPKGYYLGQFTAGTSDAGSALLDDVISRFYRTYKVEGAPEVSDTRPTLLRRIQFEMEKGIVPLAPSAPSNVGVVRLPDATADYDDVMREVKDLFARFWPDHDFLPRSLRKEETEEEAPFDAREEDEATDTVAKGPDTVPEDTPETKADN